MQAFAGLPEHIDNFILLLAVGLKKELPPSFIAEQLQESVEAMLRIVVECAEYLLP
jgi:hypothetical protein